MTDLPAVHRTVLPALPPFSFDLSLRALDGFGPGAGDHRRTDDAVRKALLLPAPAGRPDRAVVVEVAAAAGPPGVTLTVFADIPLAPADLCAVERLVARWFSLADDPAPLLAAADTDPAMAPLLPVLRGLHQVRFASLAEGAVYFTLTQRSTQWFAAARKRRLMADLGTTVRLDGTAYTAFPSLATIARLTDDELTGYTGHRQRTERLRGVVEGIAALDEEWLHTAPYDEVRAALLGVAGVGPFTAHSLLLRVLGRPDDAPLEMAQFELVARAVYGDPPPSAAEIRGRYGRHTGWWAYLARVGLGWLPDPAPAAVG
ncbi:DNA-3-methyladenine glycosylase family protein [Polymorphospora lycopeni]|uniref:DNA-3-methyladenine glycosylase II n=1 Tax=Polymorphospora lycopeni TaxID=3140240 RepID=A0ABV5CNR4_9ACTN